MIFAALFFFLLQPLLNLNPEWRMRLAGNETVELGWGVFVMGVLTSAAAIFVALPRRLFATSAILTMLGLHALALNTFIPRLGYYRQEPLKHFAQMAASQLGSRDLLVVYRRDLSSVVFYSNRRVLRVDAPQRLSELMRHGSRVDVFMHVKSFSDLKQVPKWHLVEQQRAFVWVSNRKVRCPLHSP